jgi:hypothetical protein
VEQVVLAVEVMALVRLMVLMERQILAEEEEEVEVLALHLMEVQVVLA